MSTEPNKWVFSLVDDESSMSIRFMALLKGDAVLCTEYKHKQAAVNQIMKNLIVSRFTRATLTGLLLFLLFLGSFQSAFAQQGDRFAAFVYAVTAFDGQIYHSTFVPPNINSVYLIADNENVLASRQTSIYFWPLTNRFEADWLSKNDFQDGSLEILKDKKLITTLPAVDYVVQYDANDPVATRRLASGAEAVTAYEEFKTRQNEYREALFNYYKEQQDYRKKVDELVSNAMKTGQTVAEDEFPAQPKEVEPFQLFSTEIARGFLISLPAGTYTIQLRLPDGSIQADSIKKLVTFPKLQDGISYNVVPQSRWTKPEVSRANGGIIYTPHGNTAYLQPFYQGQYNDFAYGHLLDPQDNSSRADRARWVSFGQVQEGRLEITPSGQQPMMLSPAQYKIVQMAQTGLGYEVRKLEPNSTEIPAFQGYEMTVTSANSSYFVRLFNNQGQEEPGSRREIRLLNTPGAGWIYALSSLPLLIGVGAVIGRRKSIKKIKVEG